MNFSSEKIILFNFKTIEFHAVKAGHLSLQEQQMSWYVIFADFCEVNTPIRSSFKLTTV